MSCHHRTAGNPLRGRGTIAPLSSYRAAEAPSTDTRCRFGVLVSVPMRTLTSPSRLGWRPPASSRDRWHANDQELFFGGGFVLCAFTKRVGLNACAREPGVRRPRRFAIGPGRSCLPLWGCSTAVSSGQKTTSKRQSSLKQNALELTGLASGLAADELRCL